MSVERQRRIFQLVDRAQELTADERSDFLTTECADDSALRAEVEALLATTQSPGVLHRPAFSVHAEDAAIGRRIGHYELVELLDRGGMGTVYRARRDDFDKQVALKLIRRGLDADPILVRRFHNERQILARLEHPNIAHLLDGDTTEDQLPYLVMELVDGEPIDHYCKSRNLSLEARLRLMRKVCSAVHFAHQNLVIHRDLKPDNILINDDGEPKLLDFGIAKLLDDSLAAQPLATVTGEGPMTPRYASPEQVRRQAITTASDTYSLGVLLYELLTGVDPYQAQERRPDEISRAICDEEPPRPSTAVKQRPDRGQPHVRKLKRRLSGDLDSIVLKAMRKEPAQRYRSAEELSQDIALHLEGLPVTARAGTATYRATKFVRRHWAALLTTVAFFTVSLGFGIVSNQLRREAEQQKATTERAIEFLVDSFSGADPALDNDGMSGSTASPNSQNAAVDDQPVEPTVRDLLLSAKAKALQLHKDAKLQVEILGSLGKIFGNREEIQDAYDVLKEAQRISEEVYGRNHPETATAGSNLATAYFALESYAEAELLLLKVREIRQDIGQSDAEIWRTMSNLAAAMERLGQVSQAIDLVSQVRDDRIAYYEPDDPHLVPSFLNMGHLMLAKGSFQEANDEADRAENILQRNPPKNSNDLRAALLALRGQAQLGLGNRELAKVSFEEALEIRRRHYRPSHSKVAIAQKNLASVLIEDDPARASQLLDQASATLRRILPDSWRVAEVQSLQGEWLRLEGRYNEAEPLLVEGYERLARVRGADSYLARQAKERWRRLDAELRSSRETLAPSPQDDSKDPVP